MTLQPSPPSRAASLLAALVAALVISGSAGAATPCSEAILADWLDNSRIDRMYELPCYEAAIDAIPPDLLDYTDAADVISRAFQDASGRRLERRNSRARARAEPPPGVVPAVDASASSSVPVPLLVLGGMSLILLTAGGLGYLSRRRREHTVDG